MATNDRTLSDILRMRLELDRYVSAADRELARMWGTAWQEVAEEVESAAAELVKVAGEDPDGWPRRAAVLRSQRARNALKATTEAVRDLSERSGVVITGDTRRILDSAEHWTRLVAQTQMPEGVSLSWSRVDAKALDAMVKRTTQRVHALTWPLTAQAEDHMKSVLIRGVAVGDNPRAAARQIVRRCEGAFNGGLARARTIASTELQDVHREAARRSRVANSDVLKGWRWHCTLSNRTCPSCLAQNGSMHELDEPGPHDHQNGRCTAVPVTKTWRDLGIDLDEPEPVYPDARAWFGQQSAATQSNIMGKERLAQFKSGQIGWGDLSQRRVTPGWRDSFGVTPLA